MKTLREAATAALEFMDELLPPTNEIDPSHLSDPTVLRDVQKRDALRAALAEHQLDDIDVVDMVEQEPVAWMSPGKERLEFSRKDTVYGSHTIPLYAAPQPAKRVPLTDEEINNVVNEVLAATSPRVGYLEIARAIERAHGINVPQARGE